MCTSEVKPLLHLFDISHIENSKKTFSEILNMINFDAKLAPLNHNIHVHARYI